MPDQDPGARDNSRAPILYGLRCRCPRCGRGRLFRGLLTVRDACENCAFDLKAADSGDGPAVFVILLLVLVVPIVLFQRNQEKQRAAGR